MSDAFLLNKNPKSVTVIFFVIKESRGDRESCNSFYLNPCSVKSIEYLKLLFISLGSPLAAPESDFFQLTESCLMSEKIEPK